MDVEAECGTAQLCSGVSAGIEGAVHAMSDLFNENSGNGWGTLLVDASNAFNSVNRVAALWNVRLRWPRCARFLFNTYRGYSVMVIQGAKNLLHSQEGVTQGDPLSMLMYAMAILPLIQSLDVSRVTQNWYADDASAIGSLTDLKEWFVSLMQKGPAYGYLPEPHKSFLIVTREFEQSAKEIFDDLGVTVVNGQRFLGGFIGDSE
jgi:hypothetical protein